MGTAFREKIARLYFLMRPGPPRALSLWQRALEMNPACNRRKKERGFTGAG